MNIIIVGAGISGLSLAWYLRKEFPQALITLIEASNRVGGWIETKKVHGFQCERGPHSLRIAPSVIAEFGLQDQLIKAHATTKYLAYKGKLEPVPTGIFSLFTTILGRQCIKAFLQYPFRKKTYSDDETVSSYFESRFGADFVATFIDPMMAGIYAALPSSLSYQAAFPKRTQTQQSIISFRDGLEVLPKRLAATLDADVRLNTQVLSWKEHSDSVEVVTSHGTLRGEYLFSTIAAGDVAVKNSVATVSLGFHADLLRYPGFGFLASSREEQELLGVIFDSSIFPEQNSAYATRLSVMLGGEKAPAIMQLHDDALQEKAVAACKKYLGIELAPDAVDVSRAVDAIAAYSVGHNEKLKKIEMLQERSRIKFLGASLYGVSIASCLERAEITAQLFAKNRVTS